MRNGAQKIAIAALAATLAAAPLRAARSVPELPILTSSASHNASLEDYRKHLQNLTTLVATCAQARDKAACNPALAGADDLVPLNAERRLVRYEWLRVLLAKAQQKDKTADSSKAKPTDQKPSDENALPSAPTTTELLEAAGTRLARDLAKANSAPTTEPDYAEQRQAMQQVLAGRDFRNLDEPSVKNVLYEKLGNWLNKLFESVSRFVAHAAWVGLVLVWGFILAVCLGLAWGLLQLERRWRHRPLPESDSLSTGAVSARDWQLWLKDASNAAAGGQWREAIHFLYWAAISRLESKRLWPADRARTPREYLALMTPSDPRRAGLSALTGSFERTWYGGRAAEERDYRQAEELASALISASGAFPINGEVRQ